MVEEYILNMRSGIVAPLLIGFILDTMLGDPIWLPHPVRLFGRLISFGERRLNRRDRKKRNGIIQVTVLVCLVFAGLFFMERLLSGYEWIHLVFSSIMVFYGLANRSLITAALKVEKKLRFSGLEAARKQLSTIVGRDTSTLSQQNIRAAILETLSENLSDGVIAPLFYYAIGGIPLMFAYKMVNTLDSMIGHKNNRFIQFGWFAAKLDDILNYIPARLTACLMSVSTLSWRGLKFIFLFGNQHPSPNAGYPEAALSGILNCKLGGPSLYSGTLVDKPYIGTNDRKLSKKDVYYSCVINIMTTVTFFIIILFTLKQITIHL